MYRFLRSNREALIERCKLKVAQRPHRAASPAQLATGVPMFLEQLTRTLKAEGDGQAARSATISGAADSASITRSEIGVSATDHGQQLLALGYSIGQVVHDYGDLCQAVTEMALEVHMQFDIEDFKTLNRCLDNAIAEAVSAFNAESESQLDQGHQADTRQQVGFLVHELRNALGTATLAASALKAGGLSMAGATGAVLQRSLAEMNTLMTRALDELRGTSQEGRSTFRLSTLVENVQTASGLDATDRGCALVVTPVDASLMVHGSPELLQAAVRNLLQNAYKFSKPNTEIRLRAHAVGNRALIEVADHCGGLPPGRAEQMFSPFHQRSSDRTGLGLGLSIARKSIEMDSGTLTVRDVPGTGCVFTVSLPLFRSV